MGTGDLTSDDAANEAFEVMQSFKQAAEQVVSHRCLPIPIEAHPSVVGLGSEKIPFLTFSVYSERAVYSVDPFVMAQSFRTGPFLNPVIPQREMDPSKEFESPVSSPMATKHGGGNKTFLGAAAGELLDAGAAEGDAGEEGGSGVTAADPESMVHKIPFPNWSFQLDDFELCLLPVVQLGTVFSAQLFASCESEADEELVEKNCTCYSSFF